MGALAHVRREHNADTYSAVLQGDSAVDRCLCILCTH